MKSPLTVLHVIDKLSMDGENPSSCAKLLVDWFKRFDPQKIRPLLCCIRPPDRSAEYMDAHGVEVIYLNRGKFSLATVKDLKRLIAAHGVDLLHLHGYTSANFGRMAAKKMGVPVVMHEHAILKVLPHQYIADWLLRNKTDVAVSVSEAVSDFLVNGRHVPPEKIRVIWNGIDIDGYRTVDSGGVERLRTAIGVKQSDTLVGVLTRFREEKGNRFFVAAAEKIHERHPEVHFVAYGDGPQREELVAQVKSSGLGDVFHFGGFVQNVRAALQAMDIFVMPSLAEGFGVALVEAMAAGKPVVATAVGGMKEMVQNGENGILVPPADAAALAEAILSLLDNPAKQRELGKAAQKRSLDFSIQKNVSALTDLYFELVGRENDAETQK